MNNDDYVDIKRELNDKGETILTFLLNGLIAMVREINGKKEGKCFAYFSTKKDGELIVEGIYTFKNNLLHGEYSKFSINEILLEMGFYYEGKLHGIQKSFRSTSTTQSKNQIRQTVEYKHGVLCGNYTLYFPNGKISVEQTFSNGKLNGSSMTFRSNGELSSISKYIDNQLIGDFTIFEENGQIIRTEYQIVNGISIGIKNDSTIKFHRFDYEFKCDYWHQLFMYNEHTEDNELLDIITDKEFFIAFYKFISDKNIKHLVFN